MSGFAFVAVSSEPFGPILKRSPFLKTLPSGRPPSSCTHRSGDTKWKQRPLNWCGTQPVSCSVGALYLSTDPSCNSNASVCKLHTLNNKLCVCLGLKGIQPLEPREENWVDDR